VATLRRKTVHLCRLRNSDAPPAVLNAQAEFGIPLARCFSWFRQISSASRSAAHLRLTDGYPNTEVRKSRTEPGFVWEISRPFLILPRSSTSPLLATDIKSATFLANAS